MGKIFFFLHTKKVSGVRQKVFRAHVKENDFVNLGVRLVSLSWVQIPKGVS